MAMPRKDNLLVDWGSNFDTKVTASPITYALTAAQALLFHTAYLAFVAAYTAVATARQAGARSKMLTQTKDTKKADLLKIGRELYGIVQDSNSVTPANKEDMGVVVRKTSPTPVPPPAEAPEIDILSTRGRTLRIRLHGEDALKKAKPAGVSGAAVFSFVGDEPPADMAQYKFEGNTSQTLVNITFPSDVPNGATVWVTAFWFNNRKQSGPACDPKSANLPGGSVSMAA